MVACTELLVEHEPGTGARAARIATGIGRGKTTSMMDDLLFLEGNDEKGVIPHIVQNNGTNACRLDNCNDQMLG